MQKHSILTGFMDGMKTLIYGERILAEEKEKEDVTPVYTCRDIWVLPRHMAVAEVTKESPKPSQQGQPRQSINSFQYINPLPRLKDLEPNLYLPDMALRNIENMKNPRNKMPFSNLCSLQMLTIPAGTIVAYAVPEAEEKNFVELAQVEDIIDGKMHQNIETGFPNPKTEWENFEERGQENPQTNARDTGRHSILGLTCRCGSASLHGATGCWSDGRN